MKSNILFSSLFVFTLLFSSCKKEEEAVTTSEPPTEIISPNVEAIPSETYVQPNSQYDTPVQSQTITPTTQAVTQAPVVTKPGMNPAHGQPGHRCDIAVGASLNSPVVKPTGQGSGTVQPTTITNSSTTIPATTATPAILNPTSETTATAPGMNPPHGQAGHECGIAVGAPLPK